MKALDHLDLVEKLRFETLCRDAHKALVLLDPQDFEILAKTPFGGAVMFIVNQYQNHTGGDPDAYFYIGKSDQPE